MAEENQNPAPEPVTETTEVEATTTENGNAEAAPAPAPKKKVRTGPTPKLFDRWDTTEIDVRDVGLQRYINLEPISVVHTAARHANTRFGKSRLHIVERIVNQMMRTETFTGKKGSAYRAVRDAFEIIETRAKDNPIQILVNAVINAAPREEVTRLRYGGISVPKAVDVAPSRRVDIAIRLITSGSVNSSHKSKNTIAQCLADEILKASKNDMNSYSVGKKEEVERVAKSAR